MSLRAATVLSAAAAKAHPLAWAAYASGGWWRAPRHLQWLGKQVMRLNSGELTRLVVSMPPRHGKSQFLSRYFPGWWLGTHPSDRVILISMQEKFTRRFSRQCRDALVQCGKEVFGYAPHRRASTAEWELLDLEGKETGGGLSAVGVGGTITGKGANLIVVDDIIKNWKDAHSDAQREDSWEWFTSTVLTRLEPDSAWASAAQKEGEKPPAWVDGRCVILMTRWHHDDLIGRLEKAQKEGELGEHWEFVNLPALADDEGDPLGRQKGEALWPQRWPVEALTKKRAPNEKVWTSLYQGKPTPDSGDIFKKEWFRDFTVHTQGGRKIADVPGRGRVPLEGLYKFAVFDMAGSKKRRADYTAGGVFGFHPQWKILLLLDVIHGRYEGHEIVPLFKRVMAEHKPLPVVYAERLGPFLIQKIGDVLKDAVREGVPIVELPAGDKEARAYAATGPLAAGQVFFLEKAPWREPLQAELLQFPEGEHDDQVDMVTFGVGVFQELLTQFPGDDQPAQPEQPPPWWNGSRGDWGVNSED